MNGCELEKRCLVSCRYRSRVRKTSETGGPGLRRMKRRTGRNNENLIGARPISRNQFGVGDVGRSRSSECTGWRRVQWKAER